MYQPSTIARPRLDGRLDGALERRLTCVVAGPGFGETTLLTRWAAGITAAWHGLVRAIGTWGSGDSIPIRDANELVQFVVGQADDEEVESDRLP